MGKRCFSVKYRVNNVKTRRSTGKRRGKTFLHRLVESESELYLQSCMSEKPQLLGALSVFYRQMIIRKTNEANYNDSVRSFCTIKLAIDIKGHILPSNKWSSTPYPVPLFPFLNVFSCFCYELLKLCRSEHGAAPLEMFLN